MMKTREADSEAVTEARAGLAAIVADLRAVKGRARAIARRLKVAARTAEPAGELDGEPWTEEAWLADHVGAAISEDLEGTTAAFLALARGDRWTTVEGERATQQAHVDRRARLAAAQG